MKNIVLILLVSLCIYSCQKELDFPDIEADPALVVNSTFILESDFEVEVSSTALNNVVRPMPAKIEDATVTITDKTSGDSFELTHTQEGFYTQAGLKPIANRSYSISVTAPGFEAVNSDTSENMAYQSVSFTVVEHEIKPFRGTESLYTTIEIEDNPDEKNYYLIELVPHITSISQDLTDPIFGHFTEDTNTEDISNSDEYSPPGLQRIYLPDTNFSGETYSIEIWIAHHQLAGVPVTEGNYFECNVYSTTKLLYDYERSLETHKNASGSDFSEPTSIDSNMSNGFGIFAGYNRGTISIEL